ncbi:MAG: phosphotransferase, partial [Marinobacter sp.]|nr:phosphotransferase [Marinobacter sp.]
MDTRLQQLTTWVRQFSGLEQAQPVPVSGDASFRRYFRVSNAGKTYIVMDAPPSHEDCGPFVALARHWHQRDVAVPALVEEDLTQGFLLLEDFGDELLLGTLTDDNADALYEGALQELLRIQQL